MFFKLRWSKLGCLLPVALQCHLFLFDPDARKRYDFIRFEFTYVPRLDECVNTIDKCVIMQIFC